MMASQFRAENLAALICMRTTSHFSPCCNALNLTLKKKKKNYACGSVLASGLMWLFQFAADPNPKPTAALRD